MIAIYVLIFFLGASFASFYGLISIRLLDNKSIIKPGSHCDYCKHKLKFYDLIPVISFIFLKGKCRYCGKKLLIYEPIIEFMLGIFTVYMFIKYGISYKFFMAFILFSLLIIIFITDFKEMIILDSPLVISSILIFILKWYFININEALIGLFSGLSLFLIMFFTGYVGSKIFKREALGGGDIKLSFVIGLTLGLEHGLVSLVLSTFLALPYSVLSLTIKNNKEVPFGPFLVSALNIVFLFYNKFSYIISLI